MHLHVEFLISDLWKLWTQYVIRFFHLQTGGLSIFPFPGSFLPAFLLTKDLCKKNVEGVQTPFCFCELIAAVMTAGLLASSRRQKRRRVQAVGVVRCEQAKDGGANNSLDIWLGRVAMLGFVAAVGVEIVTGKGVLEVLSFSSLCLLICGRAHIVCTYIKDLKCSNSFKQTVDWISVW